MAISVELCRGLARQVHHRRSGAAIAVTSDATGVLYLDLLEPAVDQLTDLSKHHM